jgi:hypothetical protein
VASKRRDVMASGLIEVQMSAFLDEEFEKIDRACEEASADLLKAKARYDKLEAERGELRRLRQYWAVKNGKKPPSNEHDATVTAISGPQFHRSSPTGRREAHADVARRVLRVAGRPLRTGEIVKLLVEEGHLTPEEESTCMGAVYSSMARRKTEFCRLTGGLWGLIGRDDAARSGATTRVVSGRYVLNEYTS